MSNPKTKVSHAQFYHLCDWLRNNVKELKPLSTTDRVNLASARLNFEVPRLTFLKACKTTGLDKELPTQQRVNPNASGSNRVHFLARMILKMEEKLGGGMFDEQERAELDRLRRKGKKDE